jgi:hypothetical protein
VSDEIELKGKAAAVRNAIVDQFLKSDLIEECDREDVKAVGPLFVICKPEKDRMIYDARSVNQLFNPPAMALPSATEPLWKPKLTYHAKLDISHAYYHIKIAENSRKWFGTCVNG